MQGVLVAELGDLLAATEAVGDDERHRAGGFRRQAAEPSLAIVFRHFELVAPRIRTARPCRSSRPDEFDRGAGLAQQRDLAGRSAEDRLVVAVAVDENVRAVEPVRRRNRGALAASQSASSQTCSLSFCARGSLGKARAARP